MESLVEEVNGWGPFQWRTVLIVKTGVMAIAWSMMEMAFAGSVPDWWCVPPSNTTGVYGNEGSGIYGNESSGSYGNWSRHNSTYQVCEVGGQQCVRVDFDTSISTVVNEWSLVCDLSYVKPLMTSLQMGGVLLGALCGGQLADTFGRRMTIYMTGLLHFVTSLVAAFSVTWQMFIVMRVLIGVSIGLFLVVCFPYPIEFVSPNYRQVVAFIPGWSMGVSLFALVAWLFPDWSYVHIGSAILTVPFLLTFFIMPESVRWLAVHGKLEEAEQVIEHIARINGRNKPTDTKRRLQEVADEELRAGQGRKYTLLDVYRGWRMACTTLILNGAWFALSFCYYGIAFGVTGLSGNLYFNIFLMTLVEVPSNFSTIFLANSRLGRRWTCFLFFAICSLSSFAILVVSKTVPESEQGLATTILAMISKLSVGAAWLAVQVFTSEQYPTVIRSLGYSASNTVSRAGGALAPVLLNMDTSEEVVRGYIIVGALMAVSGIVCLLLKETKGQGLQDSVLVEVKDKLKVNPAEINYTITVDKVAATEGSLVIFQETVKVTTENGKGMP